MFDIAIEKWSDSDREINGWLFGTERHVVDSQGPILIECIKAINDFIPGTTLLVFPISEPPPYGEIFRNHYLINPIHIIEGLPHVFACTDSLISAYAGSHGPFFEDPVTQSVKLMNSEVLLALHNEKHLHIVGLFTEPLDDGIDKDIFNL